MPTDSTGAGKPGLFAILREQAQGRGLLDQDAELSPALAFSLVRDMDYQRARSREPEAIISEWRGTCSGKHYLLKALFEEIGYQAKLVMCPHWFTQENTKGFPDDLKALLAEGPVPDVHTFLRINTGETWTQVDATWPLWAENLGLTVNHRFQPGTDMELACQPHEFIEVPEDWDPQEFKERVIKSFCGTNSPIRERFTQGLANWLAQYSIDNRGF